MHETHQRVGWAGAGDQRAGLEHHLLAVEVWREAHERQMRQQARQLPDRVVGLRRGGGIRRRELRPATTDCQSPESGRFAVPELINNRVKQCQVGADHLRRIGACGRIAQGRTTPAPVRYG